LTSSRSRFPEHELFVAVEHLANAGILAFLRAREGFRAGEELNRNPASFAQPYMELGTHPDVVERLWAGVTAVLPEPCQWVVYGAPVLLHPATGILFGFAQGSLTYALRLPPAELGEALAAGAEREHIYSGGQTLDVREFGDDWVLGRWFKDEPRWCLAAYEFCGSS
jgi:hypothetical protein